MFKQSPPQHASLPSELLQDIKHIWDLLGPYLGKIAPTLEQFELGFMRDAHPTRQVHCWVQIALSWASYHERYLDGKALAFHAEQQLIGALVAISAGSRNPGPIVSGTVARRLRQCWFDLANLQ